MIVKVLLAASILAAPANVYMQSGGVNGAQSRITVLDGPDTRAVRSLETDQAGPPGEGRESAEPVAAKLLEPEEPENDSETALDAGYERPSARQRFRNYLNNIASPLAVGYYATTAELLTLRNSPKEWGDRGDGFARRFANVAGKHVIMSTTAYALDEALKLDSTFYRSRNRKFTARLRNCVFSAVTARNRRGKRVPGIPMIAGGVVSEVVSSSGWYPNRYDYLHGLKGGAIAIGVAAGLNLFKEFVWKP